MSKLSQLRRGAGLGALFFVAVFAGACSGGGDGSAADLRLRCGNGDSFCIASCDLGCNQSGCGISEVAENQRLAFRFSQPVNAASVNSSSFSIRTPSGQAPDGELLVDGDTITFVPRIRLIGGVSSFGFQRNETYVITVPGGQTSAQGVRSVSGDTLKREFTCTVVASRGIIDEDGQPPAAMLVTPATPSNVPTDVTVVLRFTELIDTTPLIGSVNAGTPIRYQLRPTITPGGVMECDTTSQPILLEGIPRISIERSGNRDVTVVGFKPNVDLPGLSCIEVIVTGDLRDLAGTPATPSTFHFFTRATALQDYTFAETFANADRFDARISNGTWNNGAVAGLIGHDGRHGSFDYRIGVSGGTNVYVFNTDNQEIPGSLTLNGQLATVTDGKFYFTDFTVPDGITVRFTGTSPPRIYVRGKTDIAGRIEVNAAAMTTFQARVPTAIPIAGQNGGAPGAGGGRGGRGGDRCTGSGPTIISGVNQNSGRNGEDVRVLAGHAYLAATVNTGGRGAPLYPAAGTNASVQPPNPTISTIYSSQMSAGGAGGGYSTSGGPGVCPAPPGNPVGTAPSPVTSGGISFSLLPYPPASPPPGYSSLDHFLVGGSGGGGGGSHPALSNVFIVTDLWRAGAGGSGGGGAVAIRSGNDLLVRPSGVFEAKGGAGVLFNGDNPNTLPNPDTIGSADSWGIPAPGGGGSGGSVVLQCGTLLTMDGRIDTSPGLGSRTGSYAIGAPLIVTNGGGGSPGAYRVEANTNVLVGAPLTQVPVYDPALHRGPLTDRDDLAGSTSLWRSTARIFPPRWLRYEMQVDLHGNGTSVLLYSDDPTVSNLVANDPLGPVMLHVQGARLSQTTGLPVENSTGPWRSFVRRAEPPAANSLDEDSATGFRFMLIFNRRDYPNAVVRSVTVFARG